MKNAVACVCMQDEGRRRVLATAFGLILGILLAAGAVLTGAPAAHADELAVTTADELASAVQSALADQRTIKLGADITLTQTVTVPAGADIVIIDNGAARTVSASASMTSMFSVAEGAKLTFATSSADNSLLVIDGAGAADDTGGKGAIVDCAGSLTLAGGTLTGVTIAGNAAASSSAVRISGPRATFNMTGGIVSNVQLKNDYSGAVYVTEGGTFTMSGGEVTGVSAQPYNPPAQNEFPEPPFYNSAIYVNPTQNAESKFVLEGSAAIHGNSVAFGTVGVGHIFNDSGDLQIARMEMSGGSIYENEVRYGGGGIAVWGAGSLEMTGGTIHDNTGSSEYGGSNGGGVYIAENHANTSGHENHAAFTMKGGSITGNSVSGSGGGIWVSSANVKLEQGEIKDNRAEALGGGVYVNSNSGEASQQHVVEMGPTVVSDNTADVIGGGIWICPTGSVDMNEQNGVALFDNKADGAADDFASVPKDANATLKPKVELGNIMPGGSLTHWYLDGKVVQSSSSVHGNLGNPDPAADRYHAGIEEIDVSKVYENSAYIALKSVPSEDAKKAANSAVTGKGLVITGNEAERGGGIAANAHMVFGTESPDSGVVSIKVGKAWEDGGNETGMRPDHVDVAVFLTNDPNGERQVDAATLYADTWSYTFENLPKYLSMFDSSAAEGAECEYEVREVSTPTGYVAEVSGDASTGVTVTNTKRSLAISKAVEADEGVVVPDVDFSFTVELTGADGALTDTYQYCVLDADGNPIRNTEGAVQWNDIVSGGTVTIKGGQKAVIVSLPKGAGYEVTEQSTPGFTVDQVSHQGTVVEGGTATAAFTNTYNPTPTSGTINVRKTVTDGTWADGALFTFEITPEDDTTPALDNSTLTIGKPADGDTNTAASETISFAQAGTYTYRVREVVPSTDRDPNLYYSRAVYRVTFTVTFDTKTGSLVAEQKIEQTVSNAGYSDETPELQPVDPESGIAYATFTNTYKDPKEAVVGLNGVKNYTDITGSNPIQDNMFTFRIEPDPESPAAVNGPKPTGATTTEGSWYYDVTNTGYDFGFGNVEFKTAGKYEYTVSEVPPSGASDEDPDTDGLQYQGMTYDTHTCGVTVIVEKDDGGTLTASLEYSDHGDGSTHPPYFTFNNSYTAQPTTASLSATKELTGRDWTDSDSFTFDLKAITADAPMPDVTEGTATKETQTVTFGDITFAKAGTYQYEITERLPKGIQDDDPNADGFQHEGVTYDLTPNIATVTVTDDKTGKLKAKVEYSTSENGENTSALFTNSYHAGHAVISFSGTKYLTGRDWQAGDVFEFTIEPYDYVTQEGFATQRFFMPVNRTASVTSSSLSAGDGQYVFSFEPLRFYLPGTYTFAIKEALPADDDPATDGVQSNGITYDAEERIVVVTVADEGKGKLEVNVTTSDSSLFTNAYTEPEPTAATAELAVTKHLEGRDWTDGDSFTFALAALTDGAPLPSSQQATATAQAQTASFGTMEFTSAGTYEYKISEVLPADDDAATAGVQQNGVTYDESTCTAVVTVTEEDGVLSAHVTYDGKDAQSAAFTNRYTTTGSGNPGGTPTDDKTTGGDQDTYGKKKLARTGDAAGGLLAAAALLAVAGGVTAGVAMARSKRRS